MQIPKEQIVDLLRNQGKDDLAAQAEQHLPDQVDHEKHADLLAQHGVDPKALVSQIGGKFGL
jgi:hypothetical protein